MDDAEYQAQLARLRTEWGGVNVDPKRRGILVANNDFSVGILVGMRAELIGEIINRALNNADLEREG